MSRSLNPIHTWKPRIGALAWIIGTLQYFLMQIVAGAAWATPYSWANNNISDLGNAYCQDWDGRYVCSPLHNLVNISFIIEGVLLIVGILLLSKLWKRSSGAKVTRVLLLLTGIAWILVGLNPADVGLGLHLLGALILFIFGNIALIASNWTMRPEVRNWIRLSGFVLGTLGLIAIYFFFSKNYLGLGMGGMERVIAFGVPIWTFAVGCYYLVANMNDVTQKPIADRPHGPQK